ncbi:GtrA family protein [Candidatus Gracilibacteria bacterium]|nr:GtrA family protein [Candidatus Gracilibacteria bacterium]
MLFSRKSLVRFSKYSSIGVSTFVGDLLLLFIFTDIFGIHYIISAGVAFLLAVSINYSLSRRLVFVGSDRSAKSGYILFMMITGIGLIFVMALMYIFVDIFGFDYIFSRVIIAGVVGMWNYLMNLYFNFRVAGK